MRIFKIIKNTKFYWIRGLSLFKYEITSLEFARHFNYLIYRYIILVAGQIVISNLEIMIPGIIYKTEVMSSTDFTKNLRWTKPILLFRFRPEFEFKLVFYPISDIKNDI